MRLTRLLPLLLVPAAVITLAAGCDSGKKKPESKIKTRKTIGEKTQDVRNLSVELNKGAVLASTEISVSDPLTQAAEAYRTSVGKIGGMAVERAIQMRNAMNIMEDPKPLTYDEFMTEIIKKDQPDGIYLAELPYYQAYAWDEANQKLVVIDYPKIKEEYEKQN